jgi:hypothetical protein
MFADDGIIYSDEPIPVLEIFDKPMSWFGISLNEQKSKYVKEDGRWLDRLKFLGLEYDPH